MENIILSNENIVIEYVEMDDGSQLSSYRLIDDPEWHPVAEGIFIHPCSVVVVIPE